MQKRPDKRPRKQEDPQADLLEGHAPFGVDYVPKSERAVIVNGRVSGGKVSELVKGRAKVIALDRFRIALFRIGDRFYAIKDACPHAEYPLSKGVLEPDCVIRCASHNWRFDLRDGHCVKPGLYDHDGPPPDLTVRTFPVQVEGDDLWISVE